ncbi:MAG: class II aldolase/adducin family protein [Halobacteriota archaeon]
MKTEVAEYMRLLYRRGLISSLSGNISTRTSDVIYISPTRVPSYRIGNDEVSVVTTAGERLEGSVPSSELPTHLAIYRATPARAIVHTHSHYATVFACLGRGFRSPDVEGEHLVGKVPLIPYEEPGSAALGAAVSKGLQSSKCALLERHGSIATGADLEEASILAEAIERSARLIFDLELLNRR